MKDATVGDMIVRHRREDMAKASPAKRAEIAKKFTPRSLRNETWPPKT